MASKNTNHEENTVKKKFKNEAVKVDPGFDSWDDKDRPRDYGFDKAPILLFQWSTAFQAIVSQALTHHYTNVFHDQECGIYKTEGGCNVPGVGELCVKDTYSYWDMGGPKNKEDGYPSKLITAIVLAWDPEDPLDSMFSAAAKFIEMDADEFKKGCAGANCGGNSLSSFFDWNPFSKAPVNRKYERWCLLTYNEMTEEQVDQKYADQDLGEKLLDQLKKKCKAAENSYLAPMCCSPRRMKGDVLNFWINTGRSTQIDGWQTEEEIKKFLKSDGKLIDKMR